MTPDLQALIDRLTAVIAPSSPDRMNYGFPIQLTQAEVGMLVDALRLAEAQPSAIREAMEGERAACAKIADDERHEVRRYAQIGYFSSERIAAAIRARGEEKGNG